MNQAQAQSLVFIIFPVAGYLLGSIPFAWVIGKFHGVDIRTVGSKNIGATNLGRTLGKKYFWQAFLLDAAKGFLPVLAVALIVRHHNVSPTDETTAFSLLSEYLGRLLNVPAWSPLITAAACVIGHLFPIWLKFKGGKGVATGFGAVLGFWPLYTLAGLLGGLFFVFMLLVYRYISLASMTASVAFVAFVALLGNWRNDWLPTYLPLGELAPLVAVAVLFSLTIILRHRANIGRLLKGTEPQIGQREVDKARLRQEP